MFCKNCRTVPIKMLPLKKDTCDTSDETTYSIKMLPIKKDTCDTSDETTYSQSDERRSCVSLKVVFAIVAIIVLCCGVGFVVYDTVRTSDEQTKITQLETKIDKLGNRLSNLVEGPLQQAQDKITHLDKTLAEVKLDIDQLDDRLSKTVEGPLQQARDNITSLNNKLAEVRVEIDQLDGRLSKTLEAHIQQDRDNIGRFDTKLANAELKLHQLEERLTDTRREKQQTTRRWMSVGGAHNHSSGHTCHTSVVFLLVLLSQAVSRYFV